MHETILKFGYPDTLIGATEHWVVLLRPAQVTLGSLILACTEDARAFSEISAPAFATLAGTIGNIEGTLGTLFHYDKINYLMLMMVDPHVHFHVIPRYARTVRFHDSTFTDPGWPGAPQLEHCNEASASLFSALHAAVFEAWQANASS